MAPSTNQTAIIADRVDAAMKAKGLTLYQLADRANVPRTSLRYRLDGAGKWDVDMLYRVGQVLGFTPSEILRNIEDENAA